jgi:transposase-like protein
MSQSELSRPDGQAEGAVVSIKQDSPLEQALREGARQMLLKAIEAEVGEYVEAHRGEVDENGRRLVVRNGSAQQRTLVTGVGTLQVRAPRVEDRRVDEQGRKFRFHSQILPPYLRRTKSVGEQIPRSKEWDFRREAFRRMAERLGPHAIAEYERVFAMETAPA